MARIRTVKPEFWEDEKVGGLSRDARLLFVGTWNLADDEGLARWTADYLNASLFMYDGLSIKRVQAWMDELVGAALVLPYKGGQGQQRLGWVINFRKHQKINRPQPSRFPPPSIQNRDVQRAYGERDHWTCHLCRGPISQEPPADPSLALSLDHLVPRGHGGGDQPSNIKAAHCGCNKARRDGPVESFVVPASVSAALGHSVRDSSSHSVNGSPPDSLRARKEGKGTGKGTPPVGEPPPEPGEPKDDHGPAVARVVGAWVDAAQARQGDRPAGHLVGKVGRQAKALLAEGKDPHRLEAAARSAGSRGWDDLGRELLRLGNGAPGVVETTGGWDV